MGKLIPNAKTWVGFAATLSKPTLIPTAGEITSAVKLHQLLISLNASTTGNQVPTPDLSAIYETSGGGTTQATFTADFYRDDLTGGGTDLAWTTLARGVQGYILVSRMVNPPVTGTVVETWPIILIGRTAAALSNNTAQTFTVTCAVPVMPVIGAVTATLLLREGEEAGTLETPAEETVPAEELVEEPAPQPA